MSELKIKQMNIYEKMSNVENELSTIAKGMTVGKGANAYKAVGEADVLNAVKPLEFIYRIKSLPIKREVVTQDCYETVLNDYTKRLFFITIKTTFRFVNLDNTEDYVDVESLGDGTDPLDKSSGKAQTYADKFALLKAYKIVTGVDTDNDHSNKDEEAQKKAYKKYNPTTSSNYKNDTEAIKLETSKGLAKIMGSLNKDENKEHRPLIISQICNERKVDKWSDITFDKKFTYKVLLEQVIALLQKEKDLQQAGI